jgi:hypothetical protein
MNIHPIWFMVGAVSVPFIYMACVILYHFVWCYRQKRKNRAWYKERLDDFDRFCEELRYSRECHFKLCATLPHKTEEYDCRCYVQDGKVEGPIDEHTEPVCKQAIGIEVEQ